MKNGTGLAMGIITVAAVAAGGGYWLGNRGSTHVPDNTPAPAAASSPAGDTSTKERKLLHYRNPMGLPDTSPTPKKDPMGMDYIAVYAGGDEGGPATAGQVRISTEKVQKLGVRTEAARLRTLDQTVRAAGRIEADERRIYGISPKFEGYVERLHVNVTGQAVIKGQPLFEVYSPELVSAQREYAIAVQGVAALKEAGGPALAGMQQLAESSLQRLRNWDISDEQIKALAGSGEAKRTLTFRSTVSGIVTEKKAQQGNRFMPGEVLYQVADLSSVWVIAEVFEQDIGLVKSGAQAQVRINAYPGQSFGGKITYVYPTLKAETRTVPVRVELANPGLLLKPDMFAQVEVSVSGKGAVITVPVSAVIDSGTRQLVLVQQGEGRFEPRAVLLGARSDTHVEVIEGLKDGEEVVVAANFLIDAESNLKAAVGGFSSTPPTSASTAAPATPARTEAPAGPGPKRSPGSGHRAEGTVDSVDAKAGTISLSHGPVASLKWPAMTMEFKAANVSLLPALKPGAKVSFEFIERQPGEWVITSVKPMEAR